MRPLFALALATCALAAPLRAQCLDWSAQFTAAGAEGPIRALQEFQGELFAGGQFFWIGGTPSKHVARWDGARWRPAGAGLNGLVRDLAVFDDGGGPALYAAGDFTLADGAPASRIARWDGLRWSPLVGSAGEGLSSPGSGLAVFDDGSGPSLWVVGSFSSAGGIATSKVARWDGSEWHGGYQPALQPGVFVERALAFDDGAGEALYVSGLAVAGGLQRWNGAGWAAVGAGTHTGALVAFDDGGGEALHVAGTLIERWDGAGWTTVADPEGGAVQAALVFEGELYVAGGFDSISGLPADRVARWDGLQWTALDGLGAEVALALATFDGGGGESLWAAGDVLGPSNDGLVARWNGSGWERLDDSGGDLANPVRAFAAFDPGLGAGELVFAAEEQSSLAPGRLAGWDGDEWVVFEGPRGPAEALAVHDDGAGARLYVGGTFTGVANITAFRVAAWDGSSWAALGSGLGQRVRALASFDPGGGARLYAGGNFTNAGPVSVSHVASWDGGQWAPLGTGLNGAVYALVAFDDGSGPSLFAGGQFTGAGGVPAARAARWDGASWHPLGAGFDDRVKAFATFDDGSGERLYAGGEFSSSGGAPAGRVAVWDGAVWSEVGSGVGGATSVVNSLSAIRTAGGERLLAFGRFGLSQQLLGGAWVSIAGKPFDNVYASLRFDDGVHGERIYLGGEFDLTGPYPNGHVAAWGPESTCAESYCAAGTTTNGCLPAMAGFGQASRSEPDGFRLTASGVEGQKTGLVYFGSSGKKTPWAPGSTSFVCVAGPVFRTGLADSGGTAGACDGEYTLDFNAWMAANPIKAPRAGTFVHAQAWFRDAPSAKSANFSDAVRFVVGP